jgi:hypothetical protein
MLQHESLTKYIRLCNGIMFQQNKAALWTGLAFKTVYKDFCQSLWVASYLTTRTQSLVMPTIPFPDVRTDLEKADV